jgi:hypothetical protein
VQTNQSVTLSSSSLFVTVISIIEFDQLTSHVGVLPVFLMKRLFKARKFSTWSPLGFCFMLPHKRECALQFEPIRSPHFWASVMLTISCIIGPQLVFKHLSSNCNQQYDIK